MLKTIYSQEQDKLRELLRDLRVEAGLTQIQLAEKLKQPQPFVSKYECGDRTLDIVELREVCSVLGIPLDVFVRRWERALK